VYGPGEMILRSNYPDMPCIYLIMQGEVELFVEIGNDNTSESKLLKVLQKGDYFGELEFFS